MNKRMQYIMNDDENMIYQKINQLVLSSISNGKKSLIIYFTTFSNSFCMQYYDIKIIMTNHHLANKKFVKFLRKKFLENGTNIKITNAIKKIKINCCYYSYYYSGYLVYLQFNQFN